MGPRRRPDRGAGPDRISGSRNARWTKYAVATGLYCPCGSKRNFLFVMDLRGALMKIPGSNKGAELRAIEKKERAPVEPETSTHQRKRYVRVMSFINETDSYGLTRQGLLVRIQQRPRCDVAGHCVSSALLSHIGFGTCVSLPGPASAPGRQWLRYLCPTESTGSSNPLTFTCAQSSQGGSAHAGGAFGG
jgi:hypothetical protein